MVILIEKICLDRSNQDPVGLDVVAGSLAHVYSTTAVLFFFIGNNAVLSYPPQGNTSYYAVHILKANNRHKPWTVSGIITKHSIKV